MANLIFHSQLFGWQGAARKCDAARGHEQTCHDHTMVSVASDTSSSPVCHEVLRQVKPATYVHICGAVSECPRF